MQKLFLILFCNLYLTDIFLLGKYLLDISFDLNVTFYIGPILTFIRETKLVWALNCTFFVPPPVLSNSLGISPLAFMSQEVRRKYLSLFFHYFSIFVCHFSEVILLLCEISSFLLSEISFSSYLLCRSLYLRLL